MGSGGVRRCEKVMGCRADGAGAAGVDARWAHARRTAPAAPDHEADRAQIARAPVMRLMRLTNSSCPELMQGQWARRAALMRDETSRSASVI